MAIIEVDHVTKEYQLGQLQSLKTTALNGLRRLAGKPVDRRAPFKALDDVSFAIEQGDVVGIIGHNGAGKSTLLKLLANISQPTGGRVSVKGKVAPLIEVGAGLVGDLTGRENVYLNGSILGIPKVEIKRKFDDIVAFAELDEFIDTPIKRYSSGMQVRLGFAIATSVDADILIVDEVLAVGDLAFQRKCFDRMEDLIKNKNRTVLLVSHNIRQVERLCTRAILIDCGRILSDGEKSKVCNLFFERSDEKIQADVRNRTNSSLDDQTRSTGQATLLDLRLVDKSGAPVEVVEYHDAISVELTFEANAPLRSPVFAVGFHTPDFLYIATPRSVNSDLPTSLEAGTYVIACRLSAMPLLPGPYALRASISEGDISTTILYAENLCHFRVASQEIARSMTSQEGLIGIPATWDIRETSAHVPNDSQHRSRHQNG